MVVGGGLASYGELKVFDPLAMDPAAIAAAPNDPAVRSAAFRGSTLVSDFLGIETGTILPEGTPRKVAVLSQDRRDAWRIGVDPPPSGVSVTPAMPPSEPEGITEYTVTVSGMGPQQPDGLIHPVTLRDLDRGRWHRVDADAAGAFTLQMEVGVGSSLELIRNDRTLAYVATLGVGIEVVDVDAFYAEDPGGSGLESDVMGIYSGAGEGLELCDEPVSEIAGSTIDLGTLFDSDPLASHPLTAAGLIGFRGVALLESDPADVGEISFYNELCLKIDGSARVTGMEVLEDYRFDFDEDGKLEKDEEKDYLLVTHLTAGLLVIDATDRDLLSLVGRVRLPGAASHLGIDREERRVYVAASGEGIYVVDLDHPPSTLLKDEDADGIDDRVLETIELEGGTNAPVFLVPELGLAYAGGVERGLTSIAVGEPRIFAVADNAPDPLTEEPPETMRRRVDRLAPFGVPTAPEPPRTSREEEEEDPESLPGTEEEPEKMPGAFRILAHLPGGAGAEIFLDLVSLGPGGVEIRGAGDGASISDLPPTSFVGADGLKLTRLSDNPLDEGYQIYLSEEVAALADLRASDAFERTQDEEDACEDEERRCDDVPEDAREILSGNTIAVRFPDALRATLEPTYGAGRLDDAELELASVPWDTSPAIRQEPTQYPSYGTGDVAPGTLLHSGEYSHAATDLVVKSRGFDFAFSRTYRSQTIGAGPLGPGWDFGLGQRLRELPNGDVELYDGRGRREVFERQEDGSLKPPPGRFVTLDGGLARTSAGWLMLTRHGHRVRFDRFGRLLSIADAVKDSEDTGNEMRFRYDVRSRLIQVVDTLDRNYTLEYDDDDRLIALEDFDERRVQYAYDGDGRLIEVTSPTASSFGGGLVTAYTYDAAPAGTLAEILTGRDQLDTVTDPRGNTWLDLTWTDADSDGRSEEVTTQQWGVEEL
jgi:YD repeat-containing protein